MNFDLQTPALWATILSPIITIVSIVIAVRSLRYTINHDNKVLRHSLRLDFSKRYQDLIAAMPEGTGVSERFALLYFDLCSEEYRLWQQDNSMVDDHTWHLWKEGMESALKKHPELTDHWIRHRGDYRSTQPNEEKSFQEFFDGMLSPQRR